MKILDRCLPTLLRISVVLLLSYGYSASAETVKSPERVATEFFHYLADYRVGVDISSDRAAQERFLSGSLRQALKSAQRRFSGNYSKHRNEPHNAPDNAAFLLAWDPPKRFKVTRTIQTPYIAIVAGRGIWLADQQYPHEVRPTFFILVFERGAWRVSDIQAAKANFNEDSSLMEELRKWN